MPAAKLQVLAGLQKVQETARAKATAREAAQKEVARKRSDFLRNSR